MHPYDAVADYPYPSPQVPPIRSWRDEAACRGMPLSIFFPAIGHDATEARQICGRCPVRAECLEDSLARTTTNDPIGVFGGLRARERAAIRAERHRKTKKTP